MPEEGVIRILLLGATGYIGGGVLARILGNAKAARFHITVVVRDPKKAHKLEPFGVHAVVGDLDSTSKLQSLASEADVVLECADADHLGSTKAILAGLKQRFEATGKAPTLIHTSGTGVLTDDAAGMYATEIIYYDNDVEQLKAISPEQPHREVDLTVLAADKEGYVKSYIVLPSTIYGIASGPLVDAGIMNPQSQQIPALVLASLDRKQGGMVGEGKNIWPNVHIDDVVHLYEQILDAVLSGKQIGHGEEGYYFGENGEHTLYDVGKAISRALKEMQIAESGEPTSFSKEELHKYFEGFGIEFALPSGEIEKYRLESGEDNERHVGEREGGGQVHAGENAADVKDVCTL